MKQLTQGGRANRHGRSAEQVIDSILRNRGIQPKAQYVIGLSIYGEPLKVDFYIEQLPGFPSGLVIESKWQDASGSVDEKFPFLVENIRHCLPCPAIVIASGQGARSGALRWLRAQVDGAQFVAVYNLEEFLSWCNRNL